VTCTPHAQPRALSRSPLMHGRSLKHFSETCGVGLRTWRSVSLVASYTFLSDGWWSLLRPSSSRLTIASSALDCSTVPNSPVGVPKLPKPSTRSSGVNSWSVAEGSASDGLLARSASGVAPGCNGRLGSFTQFGCHLIGNVSHIRSSLSESAGPSATFHLPMDTA
jgi:hypothetical protein